MAEKGEDAKVGRRGDSFGDGKRKKRRLTEEEVEWCWRWLRKKTRRQKEAENSDNKRRFWFDIEFRKRKANFDAAMVKLKEGNVKAAIEFFQVHCSSHFNGFRSMFYPEMAYALSFHLAELVDVHEKDVIGVENHPQRK
ncbi:hypothetical protein Bca52824_023933 [Brassica carinata]|uniref:Uncharacterized protein n=1 Tax=Brassica carinata TaxID=52824 RepID=A0A8X7VJB2_BRACI|nr:hypothetical protein Bca52824_023933 [Brassica carinata]